MSNPTAGRELFVPNISDRLNSSSVALSAGMMFLRAYTYTSKYIFGLANRNVGRIARTSVIRGRVSGVKKNNI